jgi:hypothetical protein
VATVDGDTRPVSGIVLGLLLLGLAGHVVAAWLSRTGSIAYVHHVGGFFLIAVVTGAVIAGFTWLFWRAHRSRALLAFAAVQAVLGVLVALGEFRK